MPPSRDEMVRECVRALEDDVSWCDDFGEQTLRETAQRMSAIAVDTLSPLLGGTESDEDVEAFARMLADLAGDHFDSSPGDWQDYWLDDARRLLAELKRRGWAPPGRVSE